MSDFEAQQQYCIQQNYMYVFLHRTLQTSAQQLPNFNHATHLSSVSPNTSEN